MANDEPPYLTVGTDVSAKYKGAFCEAKIKKANRVVKCKVTFKNNLGSFMVTDDLIKGPLRIGAEVEAKHPEKNQFLEAVINKLQDYSQYTVVFDDGDETTLRRTSLCLKSGRHFAESPTLDQFPLTNPEHFGTPVIGAGKFKRKRRSTMNSSLDYGSSDDDSFPRKLKAIRGKERDPDLGKVVAVDYGDRRKKDSWYPGLIVPNTPQSTIKLSKEEHLIRSFKDGKYYQVPKRDTREFVKDNLPKIENNALKTAVDKAIQYLEKEELPAHWDKALFEGLEMASADEDSQDSDLDTSDDEPSEDKDRFVAQLYKFMDERGTPINKAPTVSNKDLNLHKLFKIMHKLGGFNKVTNQNKWKTVYLKMGLPQSNANGPNQIKCAYKRYLQSFEDFYRKLGCTMVNNSRSTRGRHRSDRNFILTRTRDRESTASPKGRNSKDIKDKGTPDKKAEEKPKTTDKKETKSEETPKSEEKQKSPEKKKIEKSRLEEKDEKQKKDERPRLVRSQSLNKEKKVSSPKDEEKKDKVEKARTREDARKEKNETPEKKGTRSSLKMEMERKEKEESTKEKKDQSPIKKDKKEEKLLKEVKDEKMKDKKDEKATKDRKLTKEKKPDDKPIKEKNETTLKEKKDEKIFREKRDSSKEAKDDKITKGRKDDSKVEEKSPLKKKLDRLAKEKKEEKVFRPRRENKSPLPDSKKNSDDNDSRSARDDKIKTEAEVKKEESVKEKNGPKLRERRDDTPYSEGDENRSDVSDKEVTSLDGLDKKGSAAKSKEDHDEPPNKGRKRSLKLHDKDDKDLEDELSDSDEEDQDKDLKDLKTEIELGDRVKVKYGRGRLKKVYDAKVLKIQTDGPEKRYFVHYNGWNNRYDEWVKRSFIVAVLSTNNKQTKEPPQKQTSSQSAKRVDRGRPPGPLIQPKPARKNSTSSTNSSLSSSRATRSDKKSLQSSPLSSGLRPKKRTRKKSGAVGLTDTSQDSDSDIEQSIDLEDDDVGDADVEDNTNALNDSCFKEELFSDDEEKEKLEDVKREDITELEKNLSVNDSAVSAKEEFCNPVKIEIPKSEMQIKVESSETTEAPKREAVVDVLPPKESEKSEIKTDDCDPISKPLSISPGKIDEKETKISEPEKTTKIQSTDKIVKTPQSETLIKTPEKQSKIQLPEKMTKIQLPEKQCKVQLFENINKMPQISGRVCTIQTSEKVCNLQPLDEINKTQILERTSKTSFSNVSGDQVYEKVPQLPETEPKILKSEKETNIPQTEKNIKSEQSEKIPEAEKPPVPENLVKPIVTKSVKPFEIIPSLIPTSEIQSEKSVFSSFPPKIVPSLNTDLNKKELKPSFPSSSHSVPENKNLSFAGLQSLIQVNAFDRNISPNKSFKPEMTKIAFNAPPKIDLKPDIEAKNISPSLFKSEKNQFFGSSSILSPSRLSESFKGNDKLLMKKSIFGFALKKNDDKDPFKQIKSLESSFKLAPKDEPKEKLDQKIEDVKNISPLEPPDKSSEPSSFKSNVLSPPNISVPKVESCEIKSEKVKDNFDLLVENKNSSTPKKTVEVKESLFSLSFSNVKTKESIISNKPYTKTLALSAENLCCIKPKRSETVDLSKTIPGIIERLKKDVVADVKGTESPPPQKEELNFNFLRSSQDTVKSLSRSESSNSLRICEDTSDTNESNTDSKDLVINEKSDTTPVIPCTVSDNAVPCPNEKFNPQPAISSNEVLVKHLPEISPCKSEPETDGENSLKASVITVAAITKPTSEEPVVAEVNPEKSEVCSPEKEDSRSKVINQLEAPSVDQEEIPKSEPVKESKTNEANLASSSPIVEKDTTTEGLTESNSEESSNSINIAKPINNNNCEKDSLFDDLLKIKNTNNFNQSSVIMWNNETKGNVETGKTPLASESEKNLSKETLSTPENLSAPMKDSEIPKIAPLVESNVTKKVEDDDIDSANPVSDIKSEPEDNDNPDNDGGTSLLSKKEGKKKRLGKKLKKLGNLDGFEREDKEGKSKGKSKKRRLENEDPERNRDSDFKSKSKKIKKNKNKKRLAKLEELQNEFKKIDGDDDHKEISDKIKKKEKRKGEKKFFKSGMKGEYSENRLELKKKKGKKNRDKLCGDKKDFLEKKTKKKKKSHVEENQDTDSDKDTPHKCVDKKKKKDRKKFKSKDSSSSDDAGDKFFKEQNKNFSNLPSGSSVLLRQDSKSDDPDMSFLLCEEKVPASPVGISTLAEDTSGSSSIDGNRIDSSMDILPLPNVYPCINNIESRDTLTKHAIDTSTVLDNTPPTTPSSTESLLSSSPSHERDSFSMNYPESTQSGRDSGEGESEVFRCNNSNRTIMRGSDEYNAATTLAFAVGKSVPDKSKEEPSHNFLKRQKSELEEHMPNKRKKKSKRVRRCSESAKSPRHKSSLSRLSKIESCCEDSSCASPATCSSPPYSNTTISFSRSPHRLSCSSESYSRYSSFYVHLHEKDPEKRIALLQDKMAALRKEYNELRVKFMALEHKRKKARKKLKEAGAASVNSSVLSEDGQSCS